MHLKFHQEYTAGENIIFLLKLQLFFYTFSEGSVGFIENKSLFCNNSIRIKRIEVSILRCVNMEKTVSYSDNYTYIVEFSSGGNLTI